MTCMCEKIRCQDFTAFTDPEIKLLIKLFTRAPPKLFSPNPRPSRKKRLEQSNSGVQLSPLRTDKLETTYPCPNVQQVLKNSKANEIELQDLASQTDVYVRIFLAVEQSDSVITLNQLTRRIYCLALALLHPKNSSVEPIVERIQSSVRNVQDIKRKVYNMLWVGRQWNEIATALGAVASDTRTSSPSYGVLYLLGSGSTWERARKEVRELALQRLSQGTDLSAQAVKYGNSVKEMINRISDRPLFETSSSRLPNNPQLMGYPSMPLSVFAQARHASTLAGNELLERSEATVTKAIPLDTENKLLLILLSFLSDSQVTFDMFCQAARTRKEWARDGGIEFSSSVWVLGHILPSSAAIKAALDSLVESSLLSSTQDAGYLIRPDLRAKILGSMPPQLLCFWRWQALYLTCAAIPWKYLDPPNLKIRKTIQPHILHTLGAIRDFDRYESLPRAHLTSLVSALAEASRFSPLKWKRAMIREARHILHCSPSAELELLIAHRELLVNRLLKEPTTTAGLHRDIQSNDRRTHAAAGLRKIQEAMDCFQKEELSSAMDILSAWAPMRDPSSIIEDTVVFRINILRGKILRYQGKFEDSLQSLKLSQDIMEARHELFFDEDIGELVSEFADTLQELGDFSQSEALLEAQLSRDHASSTKSILQLSFAECLFAQNRFPEAEAVCADLKKRGSLPKMAQLRLCIIAAKLCHTQSDLAGALTWWTEALQAMNKFPPTSGNATCVIYLSLCDVLRRQGHTSLEQTSRAELTKLQSLSAHAEAKYWITGFKRWHEYISSISS